MNDEEVPGKAQFGDHLQFALDLYIGLRRLLARPVTSGSARIGELGEHGVLGVPLWDVERRQLGGDEPEIERALPAEPVGPGDGAGPAVEQLCHLLA